MQIGLVTADMLRPPSVKPVGVIQQDWFLTYATHHHVGTATTRMRVLVYFDGTQYSKYPWNICRPSMHRQQQHLDVVLVFGCGPVPFYIP